MTDSLDRSGDAATSERYEREKEFHDARFAAPVKRRADRFYAINRASNAFYFSRLDATPRSASVLDYGCGEGAYSATHAAEGGRRVTAVDLSEVALGRARAKARERGIDGQVDFRVMNAEALDLPPESFDLVCGTGVLHHLELERSLPEIGRVLGSGGRALFLEPMGHNPLINCYRARTPEQRTPDEHPLLVQDLVLARRYFDRVDATFFHLLSLLALPFQASTRSDGLLTKLAAADRALFRRLPAVQRFAWMVVLEFQHPVRA